MPNAKATFARSSLLMLVIGAAILLGIVMSSFFLAQMTRTYFDDVTKLRALRATTADLLLLVQTAETGQRGYLLVQDPLFLEPYRTSIGALPLQLQKVERTAANQDIVSVPLDEIRSLIALKTNEMQATLSLASSGQVEQAVAIVRNQSGLEAMQKLRALLGGVIGELDGHLISGIGEIRGSSEKLQWFTVGGGILIILVLGGAIAIVFQHVRQLQKARAEVETLNAGLEERVN